MAQNGAEFTPGHWSVTVGLNGDQVVTIEANHLSGTEIGPAEQEAIRTAAYHLLSFIGEPAVNAELLEALLALERQALQSDVNDGNDWGREALGMARAAIRKARGD